jgi:outer membrane protein assembly factor BamA
LALHRQGQRVDHALGNDFEFTHYILDVSYLLPLLTPRQVLGIRVGGEFIDGDVRDIPFFELASLGGSKDLRGFFQDRFLGKHRIMVNLEYRLKLLDFRFFNMTHARIDGVLFGDAGRVFQTKELSDEFKINGDLPGRLAVGFSEEESGLVYLTFGHTF